MKENNLPFPVSSIEFEKVYKVMDKRNSLGYTARELSLLLGFRSLYVRDIENPDHTLRYTAKDTNYLLSIFRCDLSEIMSDKVPDLYYQVKVITIENKDQTITYDIYRGLPGKDLATFRKFTTEPDPESSGLIETNEDKKVSEFIDQLFESEYFKAHKTALEVFDHCRNKFGNQLHPGIILSSISKYTAKRKSPQLIREKNESSRTTYRKV